MKILPDYEHMEYRDVYTCRMYLLLENAFCTAHVCGAACSVARKTPPSHLEAEGSKGHIREFCPLFHTRTLLFRLLR